MQLQHILNEQYDLEAPVEVINAGNLGGNSYSASFYFEHLLLDYQPDVVTLLFTINDSAPSTTIGLFMTDRRYVDTHRHMQRSPVLRGLPAFLRSLRVYRWLHVGILRASRVLSRMDDPGSAIYDWFPARVPPGDYRWAIERFVQMGSEHEFILVLLYEGNVNTVYQDGPQEANRRYWDVLAEIAGKRGLPFFAPDQVFGSMSERGYAITSTSAI